jgi:nucleoside diphosphate kinase
MSSDYVVGLELVGLDAIRSWRGLIGPTNSETARKEQPQSLRAKFGTNGTQNACHGSDSLESAKRELEFFFGNNSQLKVISLIIFIIFVFNC